MHHGWVLAPVDHVTRLLQHRTRRCASVCLYFPCRSYWWSHSVYTDTMYIQSKIAVSHISYRGERRLFFSFVYFFFCFFRVFSLSVVFVPVVLSTKAHHCTVYSADCLLHFPPLLPPFGKWVTLSTRQAPDIRSAYQHTLVW